MRSLDKIAILKKILLFIAVLIMFLFAYSSYSLENFDLSRISRSNVACSINPQSLNT